MERLYMYCHNCGAKILSDGHFCQKCGVKAVAADDVVIQNRISETDITSPTNFSAPALSFMCEDQVLGVWRKVSKKILQFRSESELNAAESIVEWLWGPVDFIITEDKIIIIAAKPISKIKEMGDKVFEFGPATGVLIALVGAIPTFGLVLLTDAYEKVLGDNNKLDSQSLDILFRSGNALWAKRQELEQWHLKCLNGSGFFAEKIVYEVITGTFKHAVGEFTMRIVIDVRNMNFTYSNSTLEKVSSNVKLLPQMSIVDFFIKVEKDFPEPNWRAKAMAGIEEHFKK